MMSSPISGQSGSIYLNSPVDIDRHEDTDAENEINLIKEHINNTMNIYITNLQGQPQKHHFSTRLHEEQCFSCYLEDGLRIFQFCDTSGKHKAYVNKVLRSEE
jgi:hypothetical protein